MRLYDNAGSPYAFKVRGVLYEKGLAVERHEIRSERQREELLLVSPRGEVPALVDGETVVYDSTVICEYLEDRHPTPPCLPADAAGRARARSVERIADTQLDPVVIVIAVLKIFRPEVGKQHPQALERALTTLAQHWSNLDAMLGEREWLAGTFSRADIAVAAHVAAATFMGHGPTGATPTFAAWAKRAAARPSIERATSDALAAYRESQTNPHPFFDNKRLHWRDARIEWLVRCDLGPWLLAELAGGKAFFSPVP